MTNQIQLIADWQTSRNLHQMPYNHQNEICNILEEAIESDGQLDSERARALAREVVTSIIPLEAAPSAAVDAYCDIIVYSVGAIMKLGYNPVLALNECIREISTRTGAYDSITGKWIKTPPLSFNYKADYSKAVL